MNYSIRINLTKLKGAALFALKGKRYVAIPVDDNKEISVGSKNIYLNLVALPLKEEGKYGDTHLVKGSFDRETSEAMTQEERYAQPILGNLAPLKPKEMGATAISESDVSAIDDLPE